MKKTTLPITLIMLIVLGTGPALPAETTAQPTKVKGEVIQVMQHTRTDAGNAESFDSVMIRTRQGEEMRLVLGETGSSDGRFQVGDQVRARTFADGSHENGYRVRTMKLQRTGESFQYRNGSGDLVQAQNRNRGQNGSGMAERNQTQARERANQSGKSNGQCRGKGGRGQRGGGSR